MAKILNNVVVSGTATFNNAVYGLTKASVGLSNVDNTADAFKSVSYAASAGTSTTAAPGTATTAIATTAFVAAAVATAGVSRPKLYFMAGF